MADSSGPIEVPKMDVGFEEENLQSQDSNHFRSVLPETVWRLVMNNLAKRPDQMTKFANSSPYFRQLTSSQRTLFLFKDVFTVMTERLLKKNKDIKGLTFSSALKCRQVCSIWNKVVDKQLNGKFIRAKLRNILSNQPRSKTTNTFDASQPTVVSKFLKHFNVTHGKPEVLRNPFIWKNLTVTTINADNGMTDEDLQHHEAVTKAIRKYGRFIKEFKLEISGFEFYVEDAFKLQDWLAHMPNLKSLEIMDETPCFEENTSSAEFEDRLISANFPLFTKLNHLENINFKGVRSPIFNRFIEQNHHIYKLLLTNCSEEYDYFSLPFQNLVSFDTNIGSVEIFEKLKTSSQNQWPELLNLSILFCERDISSPFIQLSEIFQVVQSKFGSKLDTIFLQLPKATTAEEAESLWRDSVNCRLNLPNLLGVRLSLSDPMSLDFLLEMKDLLEDMLLDIGYPIPGLNQNPSPSAIVQLSGFENNIRDSNISKLFTNLDRVGVAFGFANGIKWYDL